MPDITQYLDELERKLATGVAQEHAYRPALQRLLESVEGGLNAVNDPKHIAVGAPDFILMRGEQIPIGFLEAKDLGEDLSRVERGEQMKRYKGALPNLILTDYLEFRWYVEGELREIVRLGVVKGKSIKRENDGIEKLAQLLAAFVAQEPPITATPKELAARMAATTREIRRLLEETFAGEEPGKELHQQLTAFRETLIPDLSEAQFADMYAQTLAYGLFAARVRGNGKFNRQSAAWNLPPTNPLLRGLFNEIAGLGLDPRVAWLVDSLAELLKRADMGEILRNFGRSTQQQDPVVHFYETFLAAYDPALRERRGVYYTPEPVVSYIVRSIDKILKETFGRPDGLADRSTLMLDPAAGTGTFLYFIIRHIYEGMVARGQKGLWDGYVSQYLLPRLFGFELLMAPYAMAHLKLGVELQDTGYTFGSNRRLGIYLTNTLEEAIKTSETLGFAGYISEESNQAARVKRDEPIMVVLGNPPYSGHSANRSEMPVDVPKFGSYISGWRVGEDGRAKPIRRGAKQRMQGIMQPTFVGRLIRDYYFVDGQPLGERNPKWLQDDYVKFIRFGQWRIEQTGEGVLAFVTNHGYLDNPTFRGMRQQLMNAFSEIYVLNLHGNSKKKEVAPDGGADENVFDIQQGVAISIFVKRQDAEGPARVYHTDLWGKREGKYKALWDNDLWTTEWDEVIPDKPFYLFVPQNVDLRTEYEQGWKINEAMPHTLLGPNSHRDDFAISFDSETAVDRIRDLADQSLNDESIRQKYGIADTRDWSLPAARKKNFNNVSPVECLYRPFDFRYMLYGTYAFDYHRPEINDHMLMNNVALISTRQTKEKFAIYSTDKPAGQHKLATPYDGSYLSPIYLYQYIETRQEAHQKRLFSTPTWRPSESGRLPNLSVKFVAAMEKRLGMRFVSDGRGDLKTTFGPEDVFHFIYAVFHSPTYRTRYEEFLRIDFPRVPLTGSRELFAALVGKGTELVDLHLMRSPMLDNLMTRFEVRGSNVIERGYPKYAPPADQIGGRVRINGQQYFEGIDLDVWEFQVGGYQVLEKWLKDRRGRELSFDDLTHYQRIVVALRETMRIMQEIDAAIPSWPLT